MNRIVKEPTPAEQAKLGKKVNKVIVDKLPSIEAQRARDLAKSMDESDEAFMNELESLDYRAIKNGEQENPSIPGSID